MPLPVYLTHFNRAISSPSYLWLLQINFSSRFFFSRCFLVFKYCLLWLQANKRVVKLTAPGLKIFTPEAGFVFYYCGQLHLGRILSYLPLLSQPPQAYSLSAYGTTFLFLFCIFLYLLVCAQVFPFPPFPRGPSYVFFTTVLPEKTFGYTGKSRLLNSCPASIVEGRGGS